MIKFLQNKRLVSIIANNLQHTRFLMHAGGSYMTINWDKNNSSQTGSSFLISGNKNETFCRIASEPIAPSYWKVQTS